MRLNPHLPSHSNLAPDLAIGTNVAVHECNMGKGEYQAAFANFRAMNNMVHEHAIVTLFVTQIVTMTVTLIVSIAVTASVFKHCHDCEFTPDHGSAFPCRLPP